MYEEKRKFDWLSLVMGVIFIIAALTSFRVSPINNIGLIVSIFTVTVLFKGIYMIIARNKIRKYIELPLTPLLVIGIIDILIGIYFIFNLSSGVVIAPYVFASWFLLDSIFGLFDLGWIKKISTGYFWFSLISHVIGIFVGIMLLVSPIVSVMTLSFLVGFYLLTMGVLYIVRAFPA